MSIARKILMSSSGGKKSTYVDDVFSTYLSKGTGSTKTITNGVDLTKGGLVWTKCRGIGQEHILIDSERGIDKVLFSNNSNTQSTVNNSITSFNSNGFTQGSYGDSNQNNQDYASWTFRKSKGFFDVVTYTGNGSVRTIDHNLGSVPGMIIIKDLSAANEWSVYHRGIGNTKNLRLNNSDATSTSVYFWNDTSPTASVFTVGTGSYVNTNGNSYVAYIFAGGDVTSGTSANIDITSKTVTNLGGNFNVAGGFPMSKMTDGILETSNAQNMAYVSASANPSNPDMDVYVDLDTPHVVTKYRIGPQGGNGTSGYNLVNNFNVYGTNDTSSWNFVAAFAPGQSGWTGGAYRDFEWFTDQSYRYWRIQVTQGDSGNNKAISEWKIEGYSAAVNTDSYVFGEDGDKNIISCSSYVGTGIAGLKINLGWEPQFILHKKATSTANDWAMFDSMRGIVDAGLDAQLQPNLNDDEKYFDDQIDLTPTGFQVESQSHKFNGNGVTYVYMAIRRPDSLVGKPAEAGTDVFAMDAGNGNTTQAFDSGFPVDFAITRAPASATNWETGGRLIQGKWVATNNTDAESPAAYFSFDSNTGWMSGASAYNSSYQSWMWKRGAGFDVATYVGNSGGDTSGNSQVIPHSLGKVPEMIWVKAREGGSGYWGVGHKDLNTGTNPWHYRLLLNEDYAESVGSGSNSSWYWNDTPPTATAFSVGEISNTNENNTNFLAMLFASVEGISKVGSFAGSNSDLTITTGFQPRFLIVKAASTTGQWNTLDTTRGWGAGNDSYLKLNSSQDQISSYDIGAPTATGFTLTGNMGGTNVSGVSYIYYAHA